jgi:transposase InsO family protein
LANAEFLTDDQRRRPAVKGNVLGRRVFELIGTLFTPDAILRWRRLPVAQKWDFSDHVKKKPGRPPVADDIRTLVVRLASQNPAWGYDRIQGALANLGHTIADAIVGNILKKHSIETAPDRKRQTTWQTFLQAHWDVLAAVDFTTVEVWTANGLVTFHLLFVMELATRRVHFAGCTTSPAEAWMEQIARNLTNAEDGYLNGKRCILMDRDAKFSAAYRGILENAGVAPVQLPPRSPNLSTYQERFMRSLKEECLDRLIFFGETSLRRAVGQFLEHYHAERNHQGLGNCLINAGSEVGRRAAEVHCGERLGGVLRYYYRRAA